LRQHGSVRGAEPIHYGTNIVALPEETGSNGEYKPVSKVKRPASTRPCHICWARISFSILSCWSSLRSLV